MSFSGLILIYNLQVFKLGTSNKLHHFSQKSLKEKVNFSWFLSHCFHLF